MSEPAVGGLEGRMWSMGKAAIWHSPEMACKWETDGRVIVRAPNGSPCTMLHDVTSIRHALAAFCLYGQDYGFTQDDVLFLNGLTVIRAGGAMSIVEWEDFCRTAISIADRIAALLPPEAEPQADGHP